MSKIKAISLIALIILSFSACEEETATETVKKEKIARFIEKSIEEEDIFVLGEEEAEITFSSAGASYASNTVFVMPQVNGEITDIKVKTGDKVDKNSPLFTIGNSLASSISEVQYQAALDSLAVAQQSQSLSAISAQNTIEAAKIGLSMSRDMYQNSLTTKINAERVFEEQLKSAELALKNAKDAYDNAKDAYEDAKDALYDAEDSEDPTLIAAAEAQVDATKMAKDSTKFGMEQAENAVGQLEEGYYAQLDQLDFAIESAYSQEKAAENQLRAAETASTQQELAAVSQLIQANLSAQIAKLNTEYSNVKAPINGTVTDILIKEGNFAGPGQAVIKLSETDTLLVKTQINQSEAKLVKIGDEVELETDNGNSKGKIISINPNLNETTKKVELEIETESSRKIASGEFVKIHFSPNLENEIFIPLNSIFLIDGEKYVRVLNNKNEIVYRAVTIKESIGDYTKVIEGLEGNETILKATTTFLDEGDKVKIASN